MVDAKTAEVHLTVISANGSTSERTTQFVLENGSWKHELTQAEYDLFADATATASATSTASSASHSASPSATPNPSPNPSPNRNNNAPNPNVPGNDSHMSAEDCISAGGTPVPAGTDGDGDDDGCAGE
jgi:PKD repeat protein